MVYPVPARLQRDVRLLRKALKHSLAELATGDEERDSLRRRVEDLNKTLQVCWPISSQGGGRCMVKTAEMWLLAHLCPTAPAWRCLEGCGPIMPLCCGS